MRLVAAFRPRVSEPGGFCGTKQRRPGLSRLGAARRPGVGSAACSWRVVFADLCCGGNFRRISGM
jgi:hypothetical protein